MEDVAHITQRLIERRDELEARISELTRVSDSGATISFGKRIGDGTTEAIQRMEDTSAAESLQRTLDEINDALSRVRDGSFGECVVCHQQIDSARLEFRPWATTCVAHAE